MEPPTTLTNGFKEFEIDLEALKQHNELEEGEQNLEDEADAMLKSWNREQLITEAKEDKEKLERDIEAKTQDYYDGDTEFQTITKDMTPLDGNKVYIKVLEENPDGKQIFATSTILFDRIGYLQFEVIPFDSSVYDGKPCKLSLIEGPILPGMLQALIRLREGERANIVIDPKMAYGKLGCPPVIPGDASLFYHVKIYKVFEESNLNELLNYELTHRDGFAPIEHKVALIEEHKEIANQFLRDELPREAIIRYKAAIKCLDEIPHEQLINSKTNLQLMVVLLINAAIAFNKAGMHKAATKMAKRALYFSPSNIKAYYQLTKARIALSDYSGALQWIEKADKVAPKNKCFDHLKLQLDFQYRDEKKKRDEIMRKMSKACQ